MHTLPDIAGDNALHELGAPGGTRASWVQFNVSGAGTVRIGDILTSATRGIPVDAGAGQFFPWRGVLSVYAMDGLRAYIPIGATLTVSYAA